MVIPDFVFSRLPKIIFGSGKFKLLPEIIKEQAQHVLLVTGKHSFRRTCQWNLLIENLNAQGTVWQDFIIAAEPSPALIDEAVQANADNNIDLLVAIGGGSVIDAGKAISAMLTLQAPVQEYLEGVGNKKHPGNKLPFIAVPTTSGTGTEATKNASLSQVGKTGFKKSLRHDNFVPDIALLDPQLSVSCPKEITANCGMDAFAQLLESYVSPKSTPLTDALAISGLEAIRDSLLTAYQENGNIAARAGMAYAALLSGITLAHAGLGIVHSLSSTIGGYCTIPHGVICGTLLGPGMKMNIEKLKQQGKASFSSLHKHAKVGALLRKQPLKDVFQGCEWLLQTIAEWKTFLKLPGLKSFGMESSDVEHIASETPIRNNPVPLETEDIQNIVLENLKS